MATETNTPEWMQDALVRDIPKEKLALLQQVFGEASARVHAAGSQPSQKEMLMAMLPVIRKARAANLQFTPQEMQAAIAAIKKYSTPEELQQIQKLERQGNTGQSS